jgi:hypothetical protein
MPLPSSHHAFVQRATLGGCEEQGFVDGRAEDIQTQRVFAPYVRRRRNLLEAARGRARWLLKNAARLIYLAPALVVLKVILYVIDEPTSDLTIVAFVGVVIVFFAVLNLYILISVLWWLFGRDPKPFTLTRPFDESGREALALPGGAADVGLEPPPVGQVVRARGTIVRLGPNREGDGSVLRDFWAEGDAPFRLTEAIDFAVVARGQVPVVVRLGSAPMVVAKPDSIRLDAFAREAAAGTMSLLERSLSVDDASIKGEGAILLLREGDEVEVTGLVAAHIDNVDGFELGGTFASVPLPSGEGDGAASPFRDRPGGAGLVLGEGPAAQISIRHCPA